MFESRNRDFVRAMIKDQLCFRTKPLIYIHNLIFQIQIASAAFQAQFTARPFASMSTDYDLLSKFEAFKVYFNQKHFKYPRHSVSIPAFFLWVCLFLLWWELWSKSPPKKCVRLNISSSSLFLFLIKRKTCWTSGISLDLFIQKVKCFPNILDKLFFLFNTELDFTWMI